MTATATSARNTANQQPKLYSLAHQSRWSSSSDLSCLHDRLLYLSNLHSSSSSSPAAQLAPTSGTENSRVENNDDGNLPCSTAAQTRALSELCYADSHTRRTALHIMLYWRPRLHLVTQILDMAPHMAWSRSLTGETALHMACSNATRMAGADVIERLLVAAELMTVDAEKDNNKEYIHAYYWGWHMHIYGAAYIIYLRVLAHITSTFIRHPQCQTYPSSPQRSDHSHPRR